MITGRDVARAAGVSQSTVSRALGDDQRVAQATRERVRAAARDLRSFPHQGARSLATKRTATIGVVVDDLRNPFLMEIIDDLHRGRLAAGPHTVLIDDPEALDGRGIPSALLASGMGYDDVKLAGWSAMSLTTVHQPLGQMARTSARTIVGRLRSDRSSTGRRKVFPVGLVRRTTTAAVSSDA